MPEPSSAPAGEALPAGHDRAIDQVVATCDDDGQLEFYRVARAVNSSKADGAQLIEPISATGFSG